MRLLLASILALSTLTLACSSAAQRYRDESMLCVAEHDTRSEIDACRERARVKYGVSPPAPSATRTADASAPGGAP